MDIGVVIVTYNRLQKLKIALNKFDQQSKTPKYIIVVNNASTDNTREFLLKWEKEIGQTYKRIVINCENNSGGSGGFCTGLKRALEEEANWIWVSDDDAYPNVDTLFKIGLFLEQNDCSRVGAVCTSVYSNKGAIVLNHRRIANRGLLKIKENNADIAEYNKDKFEIDEFSYVGAVLSKKILMQVGVTNPNFFLYCDDTEHSLRIREKAQILCVPSIKVIHDAPLESSYKVDWKKYYSVRNQYFMLNFRFPRRYSQYYYFMTTIKYYFKRIFRLRDATELDIYKTALKDIRDNKMGISPIYKPGWQQYGRK